MSDDPRLDPRYDARLSELISDDGKHATDTVDAEGRCGQRCGQTT